MKTSEPVTLKALASMLDVHVSTVSRVLNGDRGQAAGAASPDTIARIRELATRLGYEPDVHATGLRTQQRRDIGVLLPRLSDVVMATIYEGMDEAAEVAGYTTFVSNTFDRPERQLHRGQKALQRRVAGMVIGDIHVGAKQPLIPILVKRQIPFVLVNRGHEHYPSCTCDDRRGGQLAAEHLYDLGHRRVAVLAGERYSITTVRRTQGFTDYFRQKGIDVLKILHGPVDATSGRVLGKKLFDKRPYPTAVFAVNDFLAIGLMGVVRENGLQIGEDVAVIGYNDIPIARELPVPLSSIRVPMHEMGRVAIDLLLKRIDMLEVTSIELRPELIVRNSSNRVRSFD